jgi:hypothetical protein
MSAAGELLTLDYATFCGPDMEPFPCHCGTAECRGTVTQWDHLTTVVGRYGAHVSDYVGHVRERMFRLGLEASVSGVSGHYVLRSTMARKAGETLCDFACVPAPRSRYTIQISADQHAELLPGFLRLASHACQPNLKYDVDTRRIEVLTDLHPGDELAFFYPSTEWDMAEPFDCWCGASECLGRIAGARHLPKDLLCGYWLARHIRAALALDCERA